MNEGTSRHELQAAPETCPAIVPDGTSKTSNPKLTNGKGGYQNKNEGKNQLAKRPPFFSIFFGFLDRY